MHSKTASLIISAKWAIILKPFKSRKHFKHNKRNEMINKDRKENKKWKSG